MCSTPIGDGCRFGAEKSPNQKRESFVSHRKPAKGLL
jgi:hypothetical protein